MADHINPMSRKIARESLLEINRLKTLVESLKKTSLDIVKTAVKDVVQQLIEKTEGDDSTNTKSLSPQRNRKRRYISEDVDNTVTNSQKQNQSRYKKTRVISNFKILHQEIQKRHQQRKKERRAKETEEQRALRLEKEAQRKRDRRARETSSERRLRLQKNAELARQRRSKESEEERNLRRQRQAEYAKEIRTKINEDVICESPTSEIAIAEKEAHHTRDRHVRETSAERRLRLQKNVEYARRKRATESEEQRHARLKKQAEYVRQLRAKEKGKQITCKSETTTNEMSGSPPKARNQKSFKCSRCQNKFELKKELTKHRNEAHGRWFCCELCGKQFRDERYLKVHIKTVHEGESRKENLPVQCEECGKILANKSSYRIHCLATHNDKQRHFQCSICGKSFTCPSALHIHKVKVCEKDKAKPASCPICGKILENYILLSYHKANFHKFGNIEENVCHVCQKTLPNSFSLYNHNKSHHQTDNNSICSVCGKQCRNRVLLFDHWRTHREEKPFKCSFCHATFQQRCSFYLHRKTTHKDIDQGLVKVIVDEITLKGLKKEFDLHHPVVKDITVKTAQESLEYENEVGCVEPKAETDNGNENASDSSFMPTIEIRNPKTIIDVEFPDCYMPEITVTEMLPVREPISTQETVTNLPAAISNVTNANSEEFDEHDDEPHFNFVDDDSFEDIKDEIKGPIISKNTHHRQNSSSTNIIIQLERLEERTCLTCKTIFHTALCCRNHLEMNSHQQATLNNFSIQNVFVQYNLSENSDNGNSQLCEFCDKEYLVCVTSNEHKILKSNSKKKKGKCRKLVPKIPHVKRQKKNKSKKKLKGGFCDICGKERKNLDIHNLIHHTEKPFKCDLCPKSFISHYARKSHVEADHFGVKHMCDICGIAIKSLHYLQIHRKSHDKETDQPKEYQCDHCPNFYYSRLHLRRHLLSMHKIISISDISEKLPCPDCGKKFSRRNTLNTHRKRHSEDLPFPCSICSLQFHSQSAHDKHLGVHDSTRPFKCQHCSYFFQTANHLRRHTQSSHQNEKYDCNICGKVFNRLDVLNMHKTRIHEETKTYKCDQCPRSFVSASNLKYHVWSVHSGNKFACGTCSEEFSDRNAFLAHRKIHGHKMNPKKPYPCSICPQRFRTQKNLDNHVGIHDEKRPYSCDLCPSYFNHFSNLTFHKKNVHQKLGIVYKKKNSI